MAALLGCHSVAYLPFLASMSECLRLTIGKCSIRSVTGAFPSIPAPTFDEVRLLPVRRGWLKHGPRPDDRRRLDEFQGVVG